MDILTGEITYPLLMYKSAFAPGTETTDASTSRRDRAAMLHPAAKRCSEVESLVDKVKLDNKHERQELRVQC